MSSISPYEGCKTEESCLDGTLNRDLNRVSDGDIFVGDSVLFAGVGVALSFSESRPPSTRIAPLGEVEFSVLASSVLDEVNVSPSRLPLSAPE